MNQATLWEAYVDWISRDQGIPPQHLIAERLHALDWRKIKLIDDSIVIGEGQRITTVWAKVMSRTGSPICYVAAGIVDFGEQRALEPNRDGTPWRIARRGTPGIKLSNGALATSEGVGCILGAEGAVHHLFDPRTGRSSHRWQTITVHHDSAAVADALSTAAYCASADEIASLVRKLDGLIVWATDYSGKESRWESAIRPAGAKLLRMG